MKTKVIILIAISAVVTLSFTFASTKRTVAPSKPEISNKAEEAPIGGLVSEE